MVLGLVWLYRLEDRERERESDSPQ